MSKELPATRTSLLKAIERDAREQNLIALGIFYERYRHGLGAFLTSRYGIDGQDAEDILHDFFYEKMVDASLIHAYLDCLRQSQSGHRAFRPYLVRSLSNFTIDRLRKLKKTRGALMADLPEIAELHTDYSNLYTAEWAQDILSTTLLRTRQHYLQRNRLTDWILFVQRWIEPLVTGRAPPSYEQFAGEHHFDNAKQVGNVLTNVLRMFKQKWKEVLIEDMGTQDAQTLSEAIQDARLSIESAKHINFSRLLSQAMQQVGGKSRQKNSDTYRIDVTGYGGLLDLATDGFEQLLPIEKSLLFEHHLQAPLESFLGSQFPGQQQPDLARRTFKQLIDDPSPAAEQLESVARYLKHVIREGSVAIPATIAGVLRLTLIALADQSCDRAITSVSPNQLAVAMGEIAGQSWLEPTCRGLLVEYVQRHGDRSAGPA